MAGMEMAGTGLLYARLLGSYAGGDSIYHLWVWTVTEMGQPRDVLKAHLMNEGRTCNARESLVVKIHIIVAKKKTKLHEKC